MIIFYLRFSILRTVLEACAGVLGSKRPAEYTIPEVRRYEKGNILQVSRFTVLEAGISHINRGYIHVYI